MPTEPLRFNTRIVDENGFPTEQFQRLWAELLNRRGPVIRPVAGQVPQERGDLVVTVSGDTTLAFSYKGSDGVTRSGSITLV